MMDAMAFPGAPYIRQYANSGGTSTPQSDQNTAASVENTTTNQVQPRSVGSPPLQPRATNDGAQARRSMPPLSDHHSSSRESLNSGIQANLPSLAQLRSRGDWYPSEGTSPSHPMYARRPEYEESGMTQSGQHTNPLSSEMQRAASGAQRPLPGSSAEGYLSRPQLPSIDESLFMRPRMHSSEMAGAIDEKRSNVDPRIAYSNSPGTYDELGWNTGYRPDRVVMPHDVGSPNFPHSASTTPPLGVREDPRYDYFRSHLNYPSSRSAFPPPLHQVAPSPSPMGRSTTTQLPPLSDHLRDVPGPRRFHRPQPSSHDGPIDGAYYLQQKRLYAESYNYPQRGPPPNFGAMHGLKADHEEGSDDGFEPSSRNFRSVLPNQRSPHHHPAEAPKPYETKPAPSPAPPDQEVLDIIQRIKNRSDMKSNKRKRANQTSGLPSAPSTIQNATSARSHDIQFWRRPVHALNPKLRECAAEARKNAKKGECPVTTDDRLTSIPETKRFLGSLVYGGPKLNTRRTGRLEVEDLNLWVLPRFSSDDLFGTIEVRVPGRFLTWRGNLAVEACAVWGTDIYTDDSDIVATIIHAGRYQPYDYPTQESSTPPGRNKPEVVSKYPPQDLVVTLRILPRLFRYTGCYRYGITSRGWGTSHDGESIRIETIAEVSRKVDMQGRKRQTERWGIGRDESILWVEGIRRVRKRRRVPIVRDNPDMDNVDDEDDEDVHVDIDGDDSDESEILEEGESSEEIKLETAVTKVQESNLDSEYAESNESLPHTTFQKKLEMVTRMEALQDDSSSSMEEVDEEIVVIEKREVLPLKTVRESVTVTFSDLDGTLW
ncbi:histone deacetylation protein Rxt3-domain-containing protein [Cladochytrium replicatum]|nr:histone deacetylation protein Rxt3-domain-containing protein [Cladochytrium replicatum]